MDGAIRKSSHALFFQLFLQTFLMLLYKGRRGRGCMLNLKWHGPSLILVMLLISWSKIFLELLVSPLLYRNIDLPRIQTTNTERSHHRKAPQSFWRPPFWHLAIFCTAVCTKQLSWSLYDVKLRKSLLENGGLYPIAALRARRAWS